MLPFEPRVHLHKSASFKMIFENIQTNHKNDAKTDQTTIAKIIKLARPCGPQNIKNTKYTKYTKNTCIYNFEKYINVFKYLLFVYFLFLEFPKTCVCYSLA